VAATSLAQAGENDFYRVVDLFGVFQVSEIVLFPGFAPPLRLLYWSEAAIARVNDPVRASGDINRSAPRADIIRAGTNQRFTSSRIYNYPLLREYAVDTR
jgi:hypothetical protein